MKKIFTEVMRDVIGENFAFEPFFVREDGAVAAEAIEVIDGSGTWQINVRDEVQKISFTPASLGLENGNYLLLNVWTNETFALSDKAEFELPPHGSMLLAAADADNVLILDANMRINSAADDKVVFDYKGDAELLLARKVSKVRWNSEDIPFVSSEYNKNHLVSFKVPAAGTVELIF